jgi:negative regulator of sigma E activity
VSTHWTERFSEYLDGELTPAEITACDAHLAQCEPCRTVLAELRLVIATAQSDPEQLPVTDLWPGVLAQITSAPAEARGEVVPLRQRPPRKQFVFTLPQLALAASLLIAVSAGVAYLAAGRSLSTTARPAAVGPAIQAQAESTLPPSENVQRANFADAQFDQAVADLEQILVDMRDELDPRTIVVIERNLSAIDQAIREARAALDADPANTFLNSHLADARRKKLELLRRATMIHSTSGD